MKNHLLLLLLCCCFSLPVSGQGADTALTDENSPIIIHADPRLAVVVKKNESTVSSLRRPYKAKGYRIQIYNGNDRSKASQAKVKFMKLFPGIRSYLVYNAPNFRVRIGDFRSRKEAQESYELLTPHFSPCMIVPDLITVNPLKKNDK